VSVAEMWAFNKVFLDANGQPRPQWSTIVEAKLKQAGCDSAVSVGKRACCMGRSAMKQVWQQFLERGWPWARQSLEKFRQKKD